MDNNSNWILRVLENIVYNELIRRGYSVKIGKINKKEIDFVCQRYNKKLYIQVSYYLSTEETIKRVVDFMKINPTEEQLRNAVGYIDIKQKHL